MNYWIYGFLLGVFCAMTYFCMLYFSEIIIISEYQCILTSQMEEIKSIILNKN